MPAAWTINEHELRRAAVDRGWYTWEQIAHGLHVSTTTLWRVHTGRSEPGHDLLGRIRLAFGDDAFLLIATAVVDDAAEPAS